MDNQATGQLVARVSVVAFGLSRVPVITYASCCEDFVKKRASRCWSCVSD